MLKGVLVGFGIMLAAIPIPIVHFIAIPLSPFIAGFIGGGIADVDQNGIAKFGALMAGLMLIPVVLFLIVKLLFGVDEIIGLSATLWMIIALALIPYTWFGATVGALGGYLVRRNQSEGSA